MDKPLDLQAVKSELQPLIAKHTPQELGWISGYLFAQANLSGATVKQNTASAKVPSSSAPITILFGTHSGNSKKIAGWLQKAFEQKGVVVKVGNVETYKIKDIGKEANLLLIISTHGEGEPPITAEDFYKSVFSKRMKELPSLYYAVLALGDKSYTPFCKVGLDLDSRFAELGATRLLPCVPCDVDFTATAKQWIVDVVERLSGAISNAVPVDIQSDVLIREFAPSDIAHQEYDQHNPFMATVLQKIQLSGKGAEKERFHFEISLANSGITYEPGDSLGILPKNPQRLVEHLCIIGKYHPNDIVKTNIGEMSVRRALSRHFEITVITKDLLMKHNERINDATLQKIIENPTDLKKFLYGRNVADLLQVFPYNYSAEELLSILRVLPPRLYSISSSIGYVPDEVHVTIGAVRYVNLNQTHEGSCSTFMADQVEIDDLVPVYIHRNEGFRLPVDNTKPVIMIGAGTGIAPFRSFIQERSARMASGPNWLFYGDKHMETDFLYQTEWLQYKEEGLLTNLSCAFSRDDAEYRYVQHRIYQRKEEVMEWLEKGACIYVCGDKDYMAKDVYATFEKIVKECMGLSDEGAQTYVKVLKKQRRYQEDVY